MSLEMQARKLRLSQEGRQWASSSGCTEHQMADRNVDSETVPLRF